MPKRHLRETVAGEGAQIIPCLATIKPIPALVPEKFTPVCRHENHCKESQGKQFEIALDLLWVI